MLSKGHRIEHGDCLKLSAPLRLAAVSAFMEVGAIRGKLFSRQMFEHFELIFAMRLPKADR
jgi:hypothetical protein